MEVSPRICVFAKVCAEGYYLVSGPPARCQPCSVGYWCAGATAEKEPSPGARVSLRYQSVESAGYGSGQS